LIDSLPAADNNLSVAALPPCGWEGIVPVSFTMRNWGAIPINFWGIYDITDRGHVWWHNGAITITGSQSAFSLKSGESQPFSVRIDCSVASGSLCDAAQGDNGEHQVEIGINNKDGLTPNPFIFRVLFDVNP
jgi:hypothetical protein